jgi:hypothetical protein
MRCCRKGLAPASTPHPTSLRSATFSHKGRRKIFAALSPTSIPHFPPLYPRPLELPPYSAPSPARETVALPSYRAGDGAGRAGVASRWAMSPHDRVPWQQKPRRAGDSCGTREPDGRPKGRTKTTLDSELSAACLPPAIACGNRQARAQRDPKDRRGTARSIQPLRAGLRSWATARRFGGRGGDGARVTSPLRGGR